MAFSQNDVSVVSDAWNMADGWVKLKVLMHFVVADKLVLVAKFGAENIEDSMYLDDESKAITRIEGLNRLVTEVELIFAGSYFALKKVDKEQVNKLRERIKIAKKVMDGVRESSFDARTNRRTISINEEHFDKVIDELMKILEELATPLNNNGMIFPVSDEVDLEKMKNELIHGG